MKLYLDSETCGLHGIAVLLQYAVEEGEVELFEIWKQPVNVVLTKVEWILDHEMIGFNLSFEMFHLNKLYNIFRLLKDKDKPANIQECVMVERQARDGVCLKPKNALDLMLEARKGKFQSLMERRDIHINRVPTQLAQPLADKLTELLVLDDVYFARKKDSSKQWSVLDIDTTPSFKTLALKFAPSSGLKSLVKSAGIGVENRLLYEDIALPKELIPLESGYAPFCHGNKTWEYALPAHIHHWANNEPARIYAHQDVIDTRNLYHYFDDPVIGDDDSLLACMVGATRWKGFAVDEKKLIAVRENQQKILDAGNVRDTSSRDCQQYLRECLSDTEKLFLDKGTNAVVLEDIAEWKVMTHCSKCGGLGCISCKETGLESTGVQHKAAIRAQEILDLRGARKLLETVDKLIESERFHVDMVVIGTKSSRMAGTGGLNATGIKRDKSFRSVFSLAGDNEILCGGDFAAFELSLMDAAFKDEQLHTDLSTGLRLPALLGSIAFNMTYEEVVASKGKPGLEDKDAPSKNGIFGLAYGGNEHTLQTRIGISAERAAECYKWFTDRYKGWYKAKLEIDNMFVSLQQEKGIGSNITFRRAADYIESLFGFKRYFTLENTVISVLYNLAQKPPPSWSRLNIKVTRRDREQTIGGAVRTALYAAAFGIQGQIQRAANNHKIQSSGAYLTKKLQVRIWDKQPTGVSIWVVRSVNIHDELMVVTSKDSYLWVEKIVKEFITEYKSVVPLLAMEWKNNISSWGEK